MSGSKICLWLSSGCLALAFFSYVLPPLAALAVLPLVLLAAFFWVFSQAIA